jgi:hypothetical protein
MNRKLKTIGILFLAFIVFFIGITLTKMETVLAANVNDTVTIDVNVTQSASITVWPETLNWTSVSTGGTGGLQYLTVKNAGSIDVSDIYAYVDTLTTEPGRPYGLAYSKNYSAGGVIVIENETDTKLYFAGRIEWNWTQDIPNHNWEALTTSTPKAWGYFRNASNDFVWVLGNGTAGRCNETGSQFAIEYDVDAGTEETRTPITVGASTGRDAIWSYFSVNDASSPLNQYCVAAYYDCSKIYIYHFDKRSGLGGCTNSAYLQSVALVPGYTMILTLDAWVPNGYPAGFLNTTTLTVIATSA